MKAVLIALTMTLLTACGSARQEPTPTPPKTPSPMAVSTTNAPTETPIPPTVEAAAQPSATVAVQVAAAMPNVELSTAELLLRVYVFHVAVEAGLTDTAAQITSGQADGLEGFGMLLALGVFLTGSEEALNTDFGPDLAQSAEAARQQQAALKELLRRWVDKEITSADVPTLLEAIDTQAAYLAYLEMLRGQGVTNEEIEAMVQRTGEAIREAFQEGGP